jgi:hypothetical protein
MRTCIGSESSRTVPAEETALMKTIEAMRGYAPNGVPFFE